jgi:hypothetical protein
LYQPILSAGNNGSQPARSLPKWQAAPENCQNGRHSKSRAKPSANMTPANAVPKKIFFVPIFFV